MKIFDSHTKELEKYLRQELITQSQLDPSRVLNALSQYGTELDKEIPYTNSVGETITDSNIYEGITRSDATILFELEANSSSNNVSVTEYDDTTNEDILTYYKSFKLKIIIYGEDSTDLAIKLISRFRSDSVRTSLYNKGIYLENVSEQQTINEYKNESMWLRTDFDINIGIQQQVDRVTSDLDFNDFDLTVILK